MSAPETALALCSELNGRIVRGAFFVQEGHIVFRTDAELTDRYSAAERAASALEYNAAAVAGFWTRLATASGLSVPQLLESTGPALPEPLWRR